ncbi:MAG: response regulator transcription factor [Gammaproteobacteria bacterium]|nr:response regulator transcription factor [Gammaproteobacteria bacterium]
MRVLIVEDEENLLSQIRSRLEEDAYQTEGSTNGKDGLYLASEYPFDAAIIDLGLPLLNGIDLITKLREQGSRIPILILTARGNWRDKVEGLEAGADDYLTKPFHMEELQARLRALVRRAAGSGQNRIRFGPCDLDLASQQVSMDGTQIELTAFEYRLLEYLMRRPGKVVSKRELVDYLYTEDDERDSNVVEVMIGRLRRKLDPENVLRPLETLRGRGYRFALGDND